MTRGKPSKPGCGALQQGDYEVGYGKPPAGRRFASGTSGNPAGRPRRPRAEPHACGNVTTADRLWLEEAAAPVKVRQDGRVRSLPAQQAVMLSMRNKALAGGPMAQRAYMACVQEAQRTAARTKFEDFSNFVELEAELRAELNRRRKGGESIEDLIPHPDDILIDPRNGWARLVGPLNQRDREAFKPIVELCNQIQEEVSAAALAHRGAPKRGRAKWLAAWRRAQHNYDRMNDVLPPSMKRKLADRSSAPGATAEGDFFAFVPETFHEMEAEASRAKRDKGQR